MAEPLIAALFCVATYVNEFPQRLGTAVGALFVVIVESGYDQRAAEWRFRQS
jgi:hypothetical protein